MARSRPHDRGSAERRLGGAGQRTGEVLQACASRTEDWLRPGGRREELLVAAQEAVAMARHGARDAGPAPAADTCSLARLQGRPVSCRAPGQLSDAVGEVRRMRVDPVAPGNGSAACCCAAWRPWRGYAAAGSCVWRPARSSPRRCGCTARPDGGASSATAPSRTTRAPSASRNDRRGPVGGHAGRRPFTADPRVGRAHLALEPTPEVLPETRGVIGVRGRRRCSSGGAGRRRRGAGGGAHRGADSVNSRMTSRCPPLGRL
jgi:hypothetical protein